MGMLRLSRLSLILPLMFLLMACTPTTGSLEPAPPPSTAQPPTIVVSPEAPAIIVDPTVTPELQDDPVA